MTDTDPLLRAVAHGHPGAPDGQALVALGKLVRDASHPPQSVDLTARIIADIHAAHCSTDIDMWVERGSCADAELNELLTLTRSAAALPQHVDLTGRVRLRLGVGRIFDVLDDRTGVVRRRARIIAAVIAGHLAAGFIFALISLDLTPHASSKSSMAPAGMTYGDGHQTSVHTTWSSLMPPRLPQAWTALRDVGADLFLLRRVPGLRTEALHRASLDAAGPFITDALQWLQASQDQRTGFFGSLADGRDRNLTTQSLAILALLGEGVDNPERTTAARQGLHWLISELERGPVARPGHVPLSLASLALVEGSLLLADEDIRAAAERTLTRLSADRVQPDAEGWSGFALLAIETAQQGGLNVPGALLVQSRRALIADAAMNDQATCGRIGATTFGRYLLGMRATTETTLLTARLIPAHPTKADDGTLDLVGWFFTALALRESGDPAWPTWAKEVGEQITSVAVSDHSLKCLSGSTMRDVDFVSDKAVFATSLAILTLQTPYRYLPVE